MELVGVRNITINSNNPLIDFEVDEGVILKVLNFTHSGAPAGSGNAPWLKLNDEYVYYASVHNTYGAMSEVKLEVPYYLTEGTHELRISSNSWDNQTSGTLFGLEFKLTTP